MNELMTMRQGEIAPPQELTARLFNDFVSYIDRSERTTKAHLANLRQFMAWLRYEAIRHPLRQHILLYRDWLASEHEAIAFSDYGKGWTYRTDKKGNPLRIQCKAATIRAYLQSVKQFFKWTASAGLYPNIAENVHAPKISRAHKKDALAAEDVLIIETNIKTSAEDAIKQAADTEKDTAGRIQRTTEQGKRLNAMYLLAVNAGLRTIEISRANIKDIENKGGRACIYIHGKGHSEADQKKPIAPEVFEAIKDYLESRTDSPTGSSPLFVATGNRSGGKRIAPTTISTMLKKAMKQAGYNSDRLTAHSLRHTAAAAVMEMTENNIYAAQQYLRHSSPATTELYLENDSEKQDAIIAEQLFDHYHGKTTDSPKEKLQRLINTMDPAKLAQLAGIAEALA